MTTAEGPTTQTPTPEITTTAGSPTPGTSSGPMTDIGVPGFGPLVTLLALLGATLLMARRKRWVLRFAEVRAVYPRPTRSLAIARSLLEDGGLPPSLQLKPQLPTNSTWVVQQTLRLLSTRLEKSGTSAYADAGFSLECPLTRSTSRWTRSYGRYGREVRPSSTTKMRP